jgi:hypothetical protein
MDKILITLFLTAMTVGSVYAKWEHVAAEWDQYRLDEGQRAWFKSVRNKQSVPCCDIADGHPTEMRRVAAEGDYSEYQIPDPREGHRGEWIGVPKLALTTPGTNPIGVATVWYTLNGGFSGMDVYVRCFVPESET